MMVLQVIPDRFNQAADREQILAQSFGGPGTGKVRRPVRGIQIKDDSFATLRVVAAGSDGHTIPLVDAGSQDKKYGHAKSETYTNFLLQSVQEERMEKQQILETFGETYIFLFGERARVMTFQGILLNTDDFNWEAEWWSNYDTYLRGTRCVENQARVFLFFDETLVSGYILGTGSTKNAQDRNHVPFTFQLFVTSWSTISRLGDPNAQPLANTALTSAAAASPFRPKPVDNLPAGASFAAPSSNDLSQKIRNGFSLAESLASQAVTVTKKAFASIQMQANTITSDLNNTLNGTTVRVPAGFAGALEFDDPFVPAQPTSFTGAVKFGIYADNADEYISPQGQYGSAVGPNGANQVQFEADPVQQLSWDQKLVDQATAEWKAAGFSPPLLGPVSKQLVSAGIGLFRLGATTTWQSRAPVKLPNGLDNIRTQMNLPPAAPFGGRHLGGL